MCLWPGVGQLAKKLLHEGEEHEHRDVEGRWMTGRATLAFLGAIFGGGAADTPAFGPYGQGAEGWVTHPLPVGLLRIFRGKRLFSGHHHAPTHATPVPWALIV